MTKPRCPSGKRRTPPKTGVCRKSPSAKTARCRCPIGFHKDSHGSCKPRSASPEIHQQLDELPMKITRAIEKIVKSEFEKRDVRMAETVKETVTEAVAEAVAESEALPVAIPEAEALQSLIAQDELAASQASQEVAQEVTEAIEEAAQEVAQEAVKEAAQEVAAKPRVPDWVDLTKRVAVRNLEPLKVSLDLQYVQDSGVCE